MSSPAVILTSKFSHQTNYEGAIDYISRDQAKQLSTKEGEAESLLSTDMFANTKVEDFGNFLNYLSRKTALEKKEQLTLGEKKSYDEANEKINLFKQATFEPQTPSTDLMSTGLFSDTVDNLSLEEKKNMQHFFKQAEQNGAVLFQDVVSFDTSFLIQEGLYNPMTKVLDEKKLRQAGRSMMKKYFALENLDATGQWLGQIHYNTNHFHIHFATTESVNTRRMKTIDYKGGKRRVPHATKKLSTIKAMKSTFTNSLIDRQAQLEHISDLRNSLVKGLREGSLSGDVTHLLNDLRAHLPVKKSKWAHASLSPLAKEKLTQAVTSCLKDYPAFQEFKQAIKEESQFRQSLYTKADKQPYYENKLADMEKRLGNALLKRMKETETSPTFLSQEKKWETELVRHVQVPLSDPVTASPIKTPNPIKERVLKNLADFSANNQKIITSHIPTASLIKGKTAWQFEGRDIKATATPIPISYPVFDEKTEKLIGFEMREVFDVSQTMERPTRTNERSQSNEYHVKQQEALDSLRRHYDKTVSQEKNNLSRFSSYNQKRLQSRGTMTEVRTEQEWLKRGRGIAPNQEPVFLKMYRPLTEQSGEFIEVPFYDVSHTYKLSTTERMAYRKESEAMTTKYGRHNHASRLFYSKELSLKLSDLLKKDFDKERALYEHEQMTQTISYLQQQTDNGRG